MLKFTGTNSSFIYMMGEGGMEQQVAYLESLIANNPELQQANVDRARLEREANALHLTLANLKEQTQHNSMGQAELQEGGLAQVEVRLEEIKGELEEMKLKENDIRARLEKEAGFGTSEAGGAEKEAAA